MNTTKERFSGFEPVFNAESEILILGSFPSVKSRDEGFYYGNKQNRFWRVLASAYGTQVPTSIDEKRALILSHGIALWDMVAECSIKGSMDADIKDYRVADLSVITRACNLKKILLNGSKAYEIFVRFYPQMLNIAKRMPSTSSANVRFNIEEWLKELR